MAGDSVRLMAGWAGTFGVVSALATVPVPGRGYRLVTGGTNGEVWSWDPAPGDPAGRLLFVHDAPVNALAVVDGQVFSAGQNGKVWRSGSAEPIKAHVGPAHALTTLAGKDGYVVVVSGAVDRTIRRWDPVTGAPVGEPLAGHDAHITALASFRQPDHTSVLVSGSYDQTVRLWYGDAGTDERAFEVGERVRSIAVVELDGGEIRIAAGLENGVISLVDPASDRQDRLPSSGTSVRALAAVVNGVGRHLLAAAGTDGVIRLWDPATLTLQMEYPALAAGVIALTVIPNDADGPPALAAACLDGKVRLVTPFDGGQPVRTIRAYTVAISALAGLSDADGAVFLAATSDDHRARLWTVTGGSRQNWASDAVALAAVPRSGGATELAEAAASGAVVFRYPLDPDSPSDLTGPRTDPLRNGLAAVPTPDGQTLLAFAYPGGWVDVLDPSTGRKVGASIQVGPDVVAVSGVTGDDGPILATGQADGTVQIWDPMSGLARSRRSVGAGLTACVTMPSLYGPLLVTAHGTRIRLRDLDGHPIGDPFTGHTEAVTALAALPSPDGRPLLASADRDGQIRIWDLAAGPGRLLFGDLASYGFGDRRARHDSLDRMAMATVLTSLIKGPTALPGSDDLPGPTVIAIEGSWGSGKSSLMEFVSGSFGASRPVDDGTRLTVREAFDVLKRSPAPRQPAGDTRWVGAWFNPWAHQSNEQVWAGLTRTILDALDGSLHPSTVDRERFWLTRNAGRLDVRAIRRALWSGTVSPLFRLGVWAVALPLVARLIDPDNELSFNGKPILSAATLALLIPLVLLLAALGHTALRWRRNPASAYLPADLLRGPVLSGLLADATGGKDRPEHLRDPLYQARSGYLYLAQHDIKLLLDDAAAQGVRLVVFIDDLDRCGPQVTVEVLSAVNLFLSEQFAHARFVIGLDPVVVAAHVDQAYESLADPRVIAHDDDPSPGWTFLRKLVQLPVAIPQVADASVDRLLVDTLGPVLAADPAEPAIPFIRADGDEDELPSAFPRRRSRRRPAPPAEPALSVTAPARSVAAPANDEAAAVFAAHAEAATVSVPLPVDMDEDRSAFADADPAATPLDPRQTRDLEGSPRIRDLLAERLREQPTRSVRETKRLVTVWVYYVRLLARVEPVSAAAAEERGRSLVLLAEITTRWPALQRHLNRRAGRRHGLALLVECAGDDLGWAVALRDLGADGRDLAAAARSLRRLLTDDRYDMKAVADLAAKLA